ncbi:hypothetical protein Pint_12372 [Pistacia integerrima]|uniref:Uncharacterized protein n=1 Tax=Pistacia integerrima TaxID=434235 RepID=A0ACC0Y7P2_9ROSI|nr:hypothetical protein Pint_12372 [Pistacia integerrima]
MPICLQNLQKVRLKHRTSPKICHLLSQKTRTETLCGIFWTSIYGIPQLAIVFVQEKRLLILFTFRMELQIKDIYSSSYTYSNKFVEIIV